jgi:hypothetical protein
MDKFTRRDLDALLTPRPGAHVSLYLPADRPGAAGVQAPIRLGNLLRDAEKRLHADGLHETAVRDLLAPARKFLAEAASREHQVNGLAAFLAPDFARTYHLPLAFAEHVTVGRRFRIGPLLPLLAGDGQFYVLALSQASVKLFRGTRERMDAVALPAEVPGSLAQALRYDDAEPQRGYFTGIPGTKGRPGAVYYGVEVASDEHKENLLRYCQQIDRGLRTLFHDEHAPLVLAGVQYLLAIYRAAAAYPHLLEAEIDGNPEHMSAAALHERAWTLVQPYFARAREAALARYRELVGTGLASDDAREIVAAAREGRIGTLLVAGATSQQAMSDGDEDPMEAAAAGTLATAGEIYSVDPGAMPDNRTLAAIFRR